MDIKWESNSRVKDFAGRGLIDPKDIIKRTQTDKFPMETATVRMANVRAKEPFVTIHFRGKGQQRSNTFNNYSWIAAPTMRVNWGGGWSYNTYGVNGELDGRMDFTEVDRIVKQVAQIIES
jgi:hypothetical protein